MFCRSLPKRSVTRNEDKLEIAKSLKEKGDIEIYSDGSHADWISLMTNKFVRYSSYKYDDEAQLKKILQIEKNKEQTQPLFLNRKYLNSNVTIKNETYIVFEIDLN